MNVLIKLALIAAIYLILAWVYIKVTKRDSRMHMIIKLLSPDRLRVLLKITTKELKSEEKFFDKSTENEKVN